jgi:tRNA-binding protein
MSGAERPGEISFADFLKVDVRTGTIIQVDAFPEARKPAWKLTIDFGGEIGIKRSSAQISQYKPEELLGRQVLAVVNFPPRQIGPFMSEVLTLGVPGDSGEVILIGPGSKVPDGGRLF